ncbi:acetylserotonin O-methyltransferase-like isoform 1-T2 [Discoglossus pictus]
MSSANDLSCRNLLLEYGYAFLTSKTVFTACEMGLFDLLSQSEMSTAAIVEHMGSSTSGMEALLNACVGLKLLEVNRQNGEGFYKNTELSRGYLTKTSPDSLHSAMVQISTQMYPVANYLENAVREGKCQLQRAFGIAPDELFKMTYRSEERMLSFMYFIDSHWNFSCMQRVVSTFDLSSFHTVCDLGGCAGALAKRFISYYPESSIIIYDLPEVVKAAQKYFISPEEHRISFQEGDFFKDPIPDADLYILARILHDWSDDKCSQLLERVYNACKPGGGLLICDAVINEDRSGPVLSQMQDLLMLLCTEGKERTAAEFEKLLKEAGFQDIKFNVKGSLTEVILAIK